MVVANLPHVRGGFYAGVPYAWLDNDRLVRVQGTYSTLSHIRKIAVVAADGSERILQTIAVPAGGQASVALSRDARHVLHLRVSSVAGKAKIKGRLPVKRTVTAYPLSPLAPAAATLVGAHSTTKALSSVSWDFPEPALRAFWVDENRWVQLATTGHAGKRTLRLGDLRLPGTVKLRTVAGGARSVAAWKMLGVFPNGDILGCYYPITLLRSTPTGTLARGGTIRIRETVLERLSERADGSYQARVIGRMTGDEFYPHALSPDGTRILWQRTDWGGWRARIYSEWNRVANILRSRGIRGLPRILKIPGVLLLTDAFGKNQRVIATYENDWSGTGFQKIARDFAFLPDGKRISFIADNALYVRRIE